MFLINYKEISMSFPVPDPASPGPNLLNPETTNLGSALPLITATNSNSRYAYLPAPILELIMNFCPLSLTDCVIVNKHWKNVTDVTCTRYIKYILDKTSIGSPGYTYPPMIFGPEQWQKEYNLTNPPFAPPIPMSYIKDLYDWESPTRTLYGKIVLIPDIIEINHVKIELTPELLKKIGFVYDLVISNSEEVQGIVTKRGQKIYPLSSTTISRPNGAYWVAYKIANRTDLFVAISQEASVRRARVLKLHIWDVINIVFQRSKTGFPLLTTDYLLKPMKSGNPNLELPDKHTFLEGMRNLFNDEMDDTTNLFPFPLITRRSKPMTTPILQPTVSNSVAASSFVSNSSSTLSLGYKQVKPTLKPKIFINTLKLCDLIPGISTLTNIYTLYQKRAYKKASTDPSSNIKKTPKYTYFKNKKVGRCFLLLIPGFNIIVAIYHLCKSHKKSR